MTSSSGNSNGDPTIILVHGRGWKPAADALEELSWSAVRSGVQRDFPDLLPSYDGVRREAVYYGDLSNDILKQDGQRYDEALDCGDRRNALARLREIPARKRFGIRDYDRMPGKSALPEFWADLLSPLLGMFGLSMFFVSRLSTDFHAYLRGCGTYSADVRTRLRDRLVETLQRGDRVMLMTHGTGSAIAWDVLWQLSHDDRYKLEIEDRKVDLWLTMGAPLGDSYLRKRLMGSREKANARFPTNVISWHNVSAEDDYTCHDKTLADDFKLMMRERVVSTVHDYKIYNLAVRYGRSNPHSSIGYLIHPRIAKIIADWLGVDSAATPPKEGEDQP